MTFLDRVVADLTCRRTRGELLDRTGQLSTRLLRDPYWADRATAV